MREGQTVREGQAAQRPLTLMHPLFVTTRYLFIDALKVANDFGDLKNNG